MNTATLTTCRCNACNSDIEFEPARAGETITCPWCAQETQLYIPGGLALSRPICIPPQLTAMGETILFHDRGVLVTPNRFVIGGDTLAIRNITRVAPRVLPPRNFLPFALASGAGFVSLCFFAGAFQHPFLGGVLSACVAIPSGYIAWKIPEHHQVLIYTTDSHAFSYETPRAEDALHLLTALNNALATR